MSRQFALIHMGNDEIYGLLFVANELLRQRQKIRWFDGDLDNVVESIVSWKPDFVCFSPLTTFFIKALWLSRNIKKRKPEICSVFGGHHVSAVSESVEHDGIDIIVRGPVYGTIEEILRTPPKSVIEGTPTLPGNMFPARREYYAAIPRMANKYRKYIMSHFGCIYNCSYCTTSFLRNTYGSQVYRNFWLTRRPVSHLIGEAKFLMKYNLEEVSLEDDDVLAGKDAESWLEIFCAAWKKNINIPMYANVSPSTVVKASDKTLKILSELVNSVQMGVQTSRPESLKLFNRAHQNEKQVKEAYDRLTYFGIKVKIEIIVGLPVEDPVEDAIETVKMVQRIGPGTLVGCFPLMLYPGTVLYEICRSKKTELNEDCEYEWHSGEGSVKFPSDVARRIKNITKMATMFVKYNIDEKWMRTLIDVDQTDASSRGMSECQFLESLVFRQGEGARKEFDKILADMHFRY